MHFYKTLSVVSAALASTVVALPTESSIFKRSFGGVKITGCDLSNAQLPHKGEDPKLPDPSPGLKLSRVLLGRGTQNYTCNAGSSDKPTANGAIAILYDASCLAANQPSLLHELAGALIQVDSSTEYLTAAIIQRMSSEALVAGHHYFRDPTTPVFDFRVNSGDKDVFCGKKSTNVAAPQWSIKGKGDGGDGAVDWLKLSTVDGTEGFKEGYRMVTAGGSPPPTCKDKPSSFEVDYAAEYWFYN
ncbi:hypothetical protein FGG08_002564 [Glutinoglossum americanum]|uniref:Malate dehydrogenase n=1 Tax=Glutinoglossum americanum TaxID=1670608 RepID=A0A9P8ICK9_9PEZI|nr:hypothetical protein FGG08_002564 [Glutinoglossum americanum]